MSNRRVYAVSFAAICLVLIGSASGRGEARRLLAPTFYIAARVTYESPDELRVAGASNLPNGARLLVNVYRYIGEGGSAINQSDTTEVGKDGFFEAVVHPLKPNKFQHNLACDIVFMTHTEPPQPRSVLKVVGSNGQHLGFPRNPQVEVMSGNNYSLGELVHVP